MNRLLLFLVPALLLSGCQTIRGISALQNVDFALDRVSGAELAGINLSGVQSYGDLGLLDLGRITAAVASRDLPLQFVVHVAARNPESNSVTARLVQLDWSLLLDGTETVAGTINDVHPLAPGVTADIPVSIRLNLFEFFDRSARDLFELVQAVAGGGGPPTRIQLRATPSIDTPIGPLRYPNPITILSREVG